MSDTHQSDYSPPPSVVENTPLADAPLAAPIPADPTDAPVDMDLPPGHPDQPKPGGFLDNLPAEPEPQQKLPRSYAKDEQAWFRSLPVETQAELLAVEQRREREVHQKIREAQTAQQQVAEERAAHEAALLQAQAEQRQFGEVLHSMLSALDSQWSDLAKVDPNHWQSFAEQHPERAADVARLQGFLNTFRAQNAQAQQAYAQNIQAAQQQRAQAFEAYAAEQDRVFRERNPGVTPEIQQHALTYLETDLGLSKQQIRHLWDNEPIARSAVFQQVLHDAVQYRLGQARARQARPAQSPRPLLPGVAAPYGEPSKSSLQSAADRGDMSAYFRLRNGKGR
jgi:hypothetical protein